MEKKYWKGVEELRNDAEFVKLKHNEFAEHLPLDEILNEKASSGTNSSRRDFLKFMGFGLAAATLASCEAPVRKAIPYVVRPDDIVPGVPNYYASTYFDGYDFCPVVVKTREGRPIKVDGNTLSSMTNGGTNARVQASVLSLYDSNRLKTPMMKGAEASWSDVDSAVSKKLAEVSAAGGKIRILSSTIISPSTKSAIAEFSAKYPGTRVYTYDAVSYSAIREANMDSFGKAVIPSYHFENADVIVSFSTDFLAHWLSPIEYTTQYVKNRKLAGKKNMSRHIQIEANLSLTGSNADNRIQLRPSEQGAALLNLYNKVAAKTGGTAVSAPASSIAAQLDGIANELVAAKGKALVVCGSNDRAQQNIVNGINSLLDSYGSTIDLDNASMQHQGNDAEVAELMKELAAGDVGVLIMYGVNPAYTLPASLKFAELVKKAGMSISTSMSPDETAALCTICAPDNHYLESWNDAEVRKGIYSIAQPTIAPLFKGRQTQESLLKWAGNDTNFHDYMENNWKNNMFPASGQAFFTGFWTKTLQDGVMELTPAAAGSYRSSADLSASASKIASVKTEGLDIVLYEKAGMGIGNQSNNPWLQELPDPVSKVCWDNYLTVSPAHAKELNLNQGSVVEVKVNGVSMKVPVYMQPGQAIGSVGLALGYGRTSAGKAGNGVGVNAFDLVRIADGNMNYTSGGVVLNKTVEDDYILAATQTHHTMMGRAIVKETTLADYIKDPAAGNIRPYVSVKEGHEHVKKTPAEVSLWPSHDAATHHFGLAIDLNSCIGCGSCVISCQAENNVPVVGKHEIHVAREMHWIRIDRYYSSDAEAGNYSAMEVPGANPEVSFQPVMCQHCNHAPCETVCPVMATNHGAEGMNQMTYNRCVGTRYCQNNCPYKVRRFNWFQYSDNEEFDFNMNDDLGKMVLNPDVVVRSRGVMEKCSMCIQKIQYGKLEAKKAGVKLKDGDINTACASACPTHAIVFGDFNDPGSRIAKMKADERAYDLLEEINVKPNVFYQVKVRNKKENKTNA